MRQPGMVETRRIAQSWAALGVFALAALICVPLALDAGALLTRIEDPAAIADGKLAAVFDEGIARREIEAALAAGDSDLAKSFADLARERGVNVPPDLAERIDAAAEYARSAAATMENFARGLITGEPDDVVSLAGTALGDLFVLGDIRDAVREGSRYVSGEAVDELVLGLACVGIVVTAGTYATFGAGAPARVGLSALKAARKSGHIGAQMAGWIGRSLREIIDWPALRRAGGSLAEPVVAVRAAREAVRLEKADGLMRLVNNIGRVQAKAGTQAALDGLKVARGPADVGRIAKLAEKKGSKTRAILKLLGSGALFLSVATFNLAGWIIGAAMSVLGLVASLKSAVERLTLRRLMRRKLRAHRRSNAIIPSPA
jgi:hypothetical protein